MANELTQSTVSRGSLRRLLANTTRCTSCPPQAPRRDCGACRGTGLVPKPGRGLHPALTRRPG
jgi:hypothetical protein